MRDITIPSFHGTARESSLRSAKTSAVSDENGLYSITLRKVWVEELSGQAWIRTWKGEGEAVPEWFPHGLKAARPCLGYGVIDPLELRIDGSQMVLE